MNLASTVDIVVAGGGPAGLTTAIAARLAGMSVVVVEPRAGVIDKACGEGIMPAGVELLRALGVGVRGVPFAGVRYVHGDASAEGSFRAGYGLGVRRLALHEALRDRAAELGVRWLEGRIESLEDARAGRWLVGADGLRSRVRALLDVDLSPHHAPRFGMRRHFFVAPWNDRVEVHIAERAEAYVTPVAPDVVGIAFLFEPPGSWDALLAKFPSLASRIQDAQPASAVRGAGPFEHRVAQRVKGNVLLVGDAAGYLDPLTGEGVALGMASAVEAVRAIADDEPERYEARWRALARRHLVLTTALLAIVRRPWMHAPFIAAARALPAVFDSALSGTLSDTTRSALALRGTLRGLPST